MQILADPHRRSAIAAIAELLTRLRTDFAFVGGVARSAWLGDLHDSGAVDVLVLLSPEGRGQVPMMASHRGFLVDRDEVEAAEELDLVPMAWPAGEGTVRIHVLIASNALYGTMIRDAVAAELEELPLRVVRAEDLALLASMAGDEELRARLVQETPFDRAGFNRRARAIGLAGKVVEE